MKLYEVLKHCTCFCVGLCRLKVQGSNCQKFVSDCFHWRKVRLVLGSQNQCYCCNHGPPELLFFSWMQNSQMLQVPIPNWHKLSRGLLGWNITFYHQGYCCWAMEIRGPTFQTPHPRTWGPGPGSPPPPPQKMSEIKDVDSENQPVLLISIITFLINV